jgi:thiol-disulfide isomerase/thioredoxin
MKMKLIAIVLASVTTLAACTSSTNSEQNDVTALSTSENNTAKQLPAFKLQDAKGNVVDMNSFAGKKVFVNLWASWCPPCRREMPSIAKLYQSVDNEKAVFIMLALDDDFEKSKKYM